VASVLNVKTKFQNIRIDPSYRAPGEYTLFLDDAWQLDTAIEFKYHESLMTIPMAAAPSIVRVLICGGGDGMALREALKFSECQQATLVEIDEEMIKIFRDDERWAKYNRFSMKNPRARVIADDALAFARRETEKYDMIVLDFPSPSNSNKDKNYPNLYSKESIDTFLKLLKPWGTLSMQTSMPYIYLASIARQLLDRGFFVWNYDTYYNPRNADSFMVACQRNLAREQIRALPADRRFANVDRVKAAFSPVTGVTPAALDYYSLFCHGEDVEYEYS
jgi:spermidine synthase